MTLLPPAAGAALALVAEEAEEAAVDVVDDPLDEQPARATRAEASRTAGLSTDIGAPIEGLATRAWAASAQLCETGFETGFTDVARLAIRIQGPVIKL